MLFLPLSLILFMLSAILLTDDEELKELQKKAEQGDMDAQLILGYSLTKGDGVGKDEAAGRMWLQKAADQGSMKAARLLRGEPLLPVTAPLRLEGGDGSSLENAVKVCTCNSSSGISAEYAYIRKVAEERRMHWKMEKQGLIQQNGVHYDVLEIRWENGEKEEFYFDISDFFS